MPSVASGPLALSERAALFAQLAALEQAGLPTDRALASVQLSPALQARVTQMAQHLQQGRDLASAGYQAGLFSALEFSLLRAAQSAGSPARIYQRLARHYEHQATQAKALRSRLLMPAGVLLLALLIQPLPALVGGSLSLLGYLWSVLQPLLVLALLWGVGRQLWQHLERPARSAQVSALDDALLRLPVLGEAHARRNTRDYFESLGLLLEAGMPMFEALPKATATLTNSRLRRDFFGVQQRVLAGATLAEAILPLEFPGKAQLVGLIRTGEASGSLPAILLGHAARESAELASFQAQLATWLPRLVYALLALWMAYGMLSGAGVGPHLPSELG